jgi:DNA topoisomerase I
MPRLRKVAPNGPGYTRRRCGKGFVYVDLAGARVVDEEVIARIRALVIPPAWNDVWICPLANGHIQATGVDARGRRQYRYHDAWRIKQDRIKFDHMLSFARALPPLRERCKEYLDDEDFSRDRVLACATRLLDLGFFRIGTEGYAEQNQSYGLATIRKRHVKINGDTVTFDYVAKSGKRRIQSIVDPDVYDVIAGLKARTGGGPELLAFQPDGDDRWVDVKSTDINQWIKDQTGDEFTAKDFRTWNATVLAAVALAVSWQATSMTARKRAVTRAMAEVAQYLGNTPTVCRSSYVDPRVIDRFMDGETIRHQLASLGEGASFGDLSTHGAIEAAVLDLLEEADEAAAA